MVSRERHGEMLQLAIHAKQRWRCRTSIFVRFVCTKWCRFGFALDCRMPLLMFFIVILCAVFFSRCSADILAVIGNSIFSVMQKCLVQCSFARVPWRCARLMDFFRNFIFSCFIKCQFIFAKMAWVSGACVEIANKKGCNSCIIYALENASNEFRAFLAFCNKTFEIQEW